VSAVLEQVEARLVEMGFSPFTPSIPLARRILRRRKALREGLFVHALPGGRDFHLGISTDVGARILRDIADESDVESTAFLPGDMTLLADAELGVLRHLRQMRARVRGTLLEPPGEWRLDLPRMLRWLNDREALFDSPPPRRTAAQLRKFDDRMGELRAHPRFDDRLLDLLSAYVRRCLPDPAQTEGVFWSMTCLTQAYANEPESRTLARISVRRPAVLTVLPVDEDSPTEEAKISILLAPEVLGAADLRRINATPGLRAPTEVFRTADFPHTQVTVHTYADARRLLRIPGFVRACRLANLRLMRAGDLHPHVAAAHNHRLVQAALSRLPLR
jgi:hypothetical protein